VKPGEAAPSNRRMSYNIDTVHLLEPCDARIKHSDVEALLERLEDDLPEGCFLHDLAEAGPGEDGMVEIVDLDWTGEGSGNSFRGHFSEVAALVVGRLEAILVWEGGDSTTGLRIVDGKMTTPEVIQTLAPEDPC